MVEAALHALAQVVAKAAVVSRLGAPASGRSSGCSLDGVQTARQMYLPWITIDDETHAHATWAPVV